MTDTLKLHEITPFLINYSRKYLGKEMKKGNFHSCSYGSRWFDQTSVILKLTRMPSISAMELTLKFLPAFTGFYYNNDAIEESAQLVYDLYSTVLQAKALGKEEVDLSDLLVDQHGYSFLVELVNTSKIFCVLKQDEEGVSKPENTIIAVPDLPKGSRAVKRYIELEFAL